MEIQTAIRFTTPSLLEHLKKTPCPYCGREFEDEDETFLDPTDDVTCEKCMDLGGDRDLKRQLDVVMLSGTARKILTGFGILEPGPDGSLDLFGDLDPEEVIHQLMWAKGPEPEGSDQGPVVSGVLTPSIIEMYRTQLLALAQRAQAHGDRVIFA